MTHSPFDVLNNLNHLLQSRIKDNHFAFPINFGPVVLTASDYGGSHKGSLFETYSFFLADFDLAQSSFSAWAAFRSAKLPDGRRMSYKDLKDGNRRRALPAFLQAINESRGIIITVAIDKHIPFVFAEKGDSKLDITNRMFSKRGRWTDRLIERVIRIVAFGTFFQSQIDSTAHHVWLADNDAVTDGKRLRDFLELCRGLACLHGLDLNQGHTFATPGHQSQINLGSHLFVEDYCSIPDLFAGMSAELISELYSHKDHNLPVFSDIKQAAETISHKPDLSTKSAPIMNMVLEMKKAKHLTIVFWKEDPKADDYQVHLLELNSSPED